MKVGSNCLNMAMELKQLQSLDVRSSQMCRSMMFVLSFVTGESPLHFASSAVEGLFVVFFVIQGSAKRRAPGCVITPDQARQK